jgi:hypothetical protein
MGSPVVCQHAGASRPVRFRFLMYTYCTRIKAMFPNQWSGERGNSYLQNIYENVQLFWTADVRCHAKPRVRYFSHLIAKYSGPRNAENFIRRQISELGLCTDGHGSTLKWDITNNREKLYSSWSLQVMYTARNFVFTAGITLLNNNNNGQISINVTLNKLSQQSVLTTDWATRVRWFSPRQRQRIFPLASVSKPALRHNPPSIQWVLRDLSPGIKGGRGVTLTTHPLLVLRSIISTSYISSPLGVYMV